MVLISTVKNTKRKKKAYLFESTGITKTEYNTLESTEKPRIIRRIIHSQIFYVVKLKLLQNHVCIYVPLYIRIKYCQW